LAWLHSAPKALNKDETRKPRIVEFYKEDPRLKLPNCEEAEYMTGYFRLSGMSGSNGYGAVPLTWQEIQAFDNCSGLHLDSWERRQLRNMSQVYCNVKAENPNISPYVREFTEEEEIAFGSIQLKAMENSEKKASEI